MDYVTILTAARGQLTKTIVSTENARTAKIIQTPAGRARFIYRFEWGYDEYVIVSRVHDEKVKCLVSRCYGIRKFENALRGHVTNSLRLDVRPSVYKFDHDGTPRDIMPDDKLIKKFGKSKLISDGLREWINSYIDPDDQFKSGDPADMPIDAHVDMPIDAHVDGPIAADG